MNKGGYSTPPQYRNNDYRYPPGPGRYQPYNHPPPDRFDSRQRPVMHQNDYYPEVNYPSPRQGRPDLPPRDDIPPFSRGRGRDRDFSGNQYNRPSPPPGPPPLNPQFRDYPRFPHPPPPYINSNNSNNSNNNSPLPNTPNNNNNNNNTNTPTTTNNAGNNNNNSNNTSNNHPSYSPRERPPEYVRDFHYRQESPKPPPPLKHPPNSPNLNYDNFNRMIPDNRLAPNIPQFHRNNDFPLNPPNIDHNDLQNLANNQTQFQINSPPRNPIHLMTLKQNLPIPQNFHHPLIPISNPIPLNPAEIESQKLELEESSRNIVLEIDLDYKKYQYDKACRKIDVVQAKLDAIMNKLSELEAEKTTNPSPSSL